MKALNLLFLIAAISLALSCQKGTVGIEEPDVTTSVEEPKDTIVNREPVPDALPIELRLAGKVETDNAFSLDLFKHTLARSKEPNVFLSPLSVSMALSMTLNGAVGKTAEEMLTALRAEGYTIDEINEYCRELRQALVNIDPLTELAIANSIWYRDHNFLVKDAFLNVNKTFFDAEVNAVNFGAPGTLERINGWCADKTNNKIETIVDEVSNKILMILANAVYFKGIWTSQFQKDDTREATFNSESGPTTVQMMQQTDYFAYTTNEHAAWLALPYGNKAFEMIVILPHNNTVDGIIDNLNRKSWVEITESMQPRSVKLSLPRFKSECEYYLEESILPAMGMKIPFTYLSADFSGISDSAPCISTVIHKTFVEVNEEGTEAAAVTGVVFEMSYTEPTVFNVNKPFLFAIRERSTGGILFIGKMGVIEN